MLGPPRGRDAGSALEATFTNTEQLVDHRSRRPGRRRPGAVLQMDLDAGGGQLRGRSARSAA